MSVLVPDRMNRKNMEAFNKTYTPRHLEGRLSYGLRILKSLAQIFQVRL